MQSFLCIYCYFLYLYVIQVFIISIFVQFLCKTSGIPPSEGFPESQSISQKITSNYSQKLATYVGRRTPHAIKILLMERVFIPFFISNLIHLVYTVYTQNKSRLRGSGTWLRIRKQGKSRWVSVPK